MVREAADNDVRLQFVAALDAWVELEHALGKLFYVLLKPIPFPRSQIMFASIQGFQAQRESIKAIMEDVLEGEKHEPLKERVGRLLDRARNLATKRNRLVHGRWGYHTGERRGQAFRVLFRHYLHPNISVWGKPTATWIYDLKGNLTFFIDDLKRCQGEFHSLAEEVSECLAAVAAALGVSPAIEIPAGEAHEFRDLSNPPSSHPPGKP